MWAMATNHSNVNLYCDENWTRNSLHTAIHLSLNKVFQEFGIAFLLFICITKPKFQCIYQNLYHWKHSFVETDVYLTLTALNKYLHFISILLYITKTNRNNNLNIVDHVTHYYIYRFYQQLHDNLYLTIPELIWWKRLISHFFPIK